MDVREDNREEALLPKLLPLIFFNGAFAVAYAGILLREISARTYATELAYLVPGILFLFFAACSGIAGRLFLNRVSSSAGSFPSMLPVLFSAILLPLLLPLLSMTRRSITSAAVLLPLLALPLFFSGLNIHFILKLAAPARSPLLFAIHYLGAAFSGILFAVLVHSLGDTLLLLLLTGLFLVILSLILHLPLLKRMLPCILLLLTALLSSAALIHTACGYLEQRLAHADPLRGKDAIRIDTPYGRAELLRLPDKRFLITNNGQVVGATGFNVRTGQFHVFHARNTILCTGSCSFKGQYHGQDMVSGEGNDMALRVGAEFTNMEFANTYNATAKDFDICGMSRFQCLGGRFTNALGETFMHKYDPVQGEGAMLHILVRAMTQEVRAGRGPISFDLRGMSEEDKDLSRRMLPMFFEACASKGVDPFSEPVEWIPGFMGSTSCGAGLTLKSFSCDTTIPGLFAAGDMANQGLVMGAIAGPGGINLGWALVTGWKAGEGAAEACEGQAQLPVDEAQIAALKEKTFAKFGHKGHMSVGDAIYRIQSLTIPAKYNIIRSEASLREALAGLDEVERDIEANVAVRDMHELMLYHELHGMLATARLTFTSALQRKESRGSHYREDYTETDGEHWNVWLKSSFKDGKIVVEAEPIPLEKFERYGLDVLPR